MRGSRSARRRWRLAVMVAAALVVGTATPAGAQSAVTPPLTGLPAPFRDWNVTVRPVDGKPQVLRVAYDSPLLHRRAVNTVYLPDAYQDTGTPWPVVYSLHGTVLPPLGGVDSDPVGDAVPSLALTGPGSGQRQTDFTRYDKQLSRARFLVVAPDTTSGRPWCETCAWIDGRQDLLPNPRPVTAETVPADSVLHGELYPLIESVFNVRSDRAGRGVTGFSMGGWGALLQGLKHPDKYSFVASVSGAYDMFTDPFGRLGVLELAGYLRDQGYGTSFTNPTWWHNFSPASLLGNISGVPTKLMLTSGDACLPAESGNSPTCQRQPAYSDPVLTYIEIAAARQLDLARLDLPAKGVPAQIVRRPGLHGANNAQMYAEHILPEANRTFAHPIAEPDAFTFRAVEPRFSVWGYDAYIDRAADEFFTLAKAGRNGRAFTLVGTGTASITTPPAFEPGSRHAVNIAPDNSEPHTVNTTADRYGRVHIKVGVGSSTTIEHALAGVMLNTPATSTRVHIAEAPTFAPGMP